MMQQIPAPIQIRLSLLILNLILEQNLLLRFIIRRIWIEELRSNLLR
jgi:hypothetical protein